MYSRRAGVSYLTSVQSAIACLIATTRRCWPRSIGTGRHSSGRPTATRRAPPGTGVDGGEGSGSATTGGGSPRNSWSTSTSRPTTVPLHAAVGVSGGLDDRAAGSEPRSAGSVRPTATRCAAGGATTSFDARRRSDVGVTSSGAAALTATFVDAQRTCWCASDTANRCYCSWTVIQYCQSKDVITATIRLHHVLTRKKSRCNSRFAMQVLACYYLALVPFIAHSHEDVNMRVLR